MRWRDLSRAERVFVIRALLAGYRGDLRLPSGEWYRPWLWARLT